MKFSLSYPCFSSHFISSIWSHFSFSSISYINCLISSLDSSKSRNHCSHSISPSFIFSFSYFTSFLKDMRHLSFLMDIFSSSYIIWSLFKDYFLPSFSKDIFLSFSFIFSLSYFTSYLSDVRLFFSFLKGVLSY